MGHSQAKEDHDTLARKLITQRSRQSLLEEPVESPGYELQWSHLIHAEIISVTSAMRRNSRWSGMSVSGLSMGSLGMNMGLRGRENQKEGAYRNQVRTPSSHIRSVDVILGCVLIRPQRCILVLPYS